MDDTGHHLGGKEDNEKITKSNWKIDITSESEIKMYYVRLEGVKKYPSLDSSEPLGLWRVASHRVEDVDQHQEQGHQQGHSTCKFQIEVWLMG